MPPDTAFFCVGGIRNGSVVGFTNSDVISSEALLELQCDTLVSAALENQITLENVDHIHTRIVAEAANGPLLTWGCRLRRARPVGGAGYSCQSGGVSHSGIANTGLNSLVVL